MIASFFAWIILLSPGMFASPHYESTSSMFASSVPLLPIPIIDTPLVDSLHPDSTSTMNDTIVFDFGHGFMSNRKHVFSIPEFSDARQVPYTEPFSMIDFNRVTGFFLGLGTPGQIDLGPHDAVGAEGGAGYGFASKRWEYRLGGEFRLPLADMQKIEDDTTFSKHFYLPPTLAVGAGFHNITSTDDDWREPRLENALDAFFAREDFRDYYKLAGWDGYLAFRPTLHSELRVEWRSDHYDSLSQNVFYGRFGGDKVLPVNPPVNEGTMNSLVITQQEERVHTRDIVVRNLFGDSVEIEQLHGMSTLAQIELGHMPGSDFGFNRYLLDARGFHPLLPGLSFDMRLRFEATTGDMLAQKIEYLGGPSSLPALYDKSIVGNRMLLFNTEIRINPMIFSSFFHSPDFNLIIYNDFGKMGIASEGESIFEGYQFSGINSIWYNVGVGIGWTSGIQVGASWRTDIKADPRIMFRLQRPF